MRLGVGTTIGFAVLVSALACGESQVARVAHEPATQSSAQSQTDAAAPARGSEDSAAEPAKLPEPKPAEPKPPEPKAPEPKEPAPKPLPPSADDDADAGQHVGDASLDAGSDASRPGCANLLWHSYEAGEPIPWVITGCTECHCGEDGMLACSGGRCEHSCMHDGVRLYPGQNVAANCNLCECKDDGRVICGTDKCGPDCVVKGKHYRTWEGFPDDCNTCTCQPNGKVLCTLIGCADAGR